MSTTTFFAIFLGLYFLIMSWSILLNHEYYHKLIKDALKHEGIVFSFAVMGLMLGLVVVLLHQKWFSFSVGLVSLLGWVILIKAIFVLLLPERAEQLAKLYGNKNWFWLSGVVYLVLGLYLTAVGMFSVLGL